MDPQRKIILQYNLGLMLDALSFLYEDCEPEPGEVFPRAVRQVAAVFVDTYESGHRHLNPVDALRSLAGVVIDRTASNKRCRDAEQLTTALAQVVDDFLLDGVRDEITPREWKMKVRTRLLVEGILDKVDEQEVANFLAHVNRNLRLEPLAGKWAVRRFTPLANLAGEFLPSVPVDEQLVLVNLINQMIALTEAELVDLDRERRT